MSYHAFVDDVADSLWLAAVADAVERAQAEGSETAAEFAPGAGGDWQDTDYRPVPASVVELVRETLRRFEQQTGDLLEEGFVAWLYLSGETSQRFAHCIALRMLGHGVGLHDDVRLSAVATSEDRARADVVARLHRALPYVEVVAEWDEHTRRPVPL